MTEKHIPVLLDDVVDVLIPRDGAVYVDATFGAGGYSRALLEAADCTVWGIDRDPDAAHAGNELAAGYGNRLTVLNGRFGDMRETLAEVGVTEVDGALVGDVDFEAAQGIAGIITPSRRGIGPMTITMLLANTVKAAGISVGSVG